MNNILEIQNQILALDKLHIRAQAKKSSFGFKVI